MSDDVPVGRGPHRLDVRLDRRLRRAQVQLGDQLVYGTSYDGTNDALRPAPTFPGGFQSRTPRTPLCDALVANARA